ncbi:MAG: hypothetical protein JW929_03995 [Anaerolineales bacterium]|nr:hypothetical protein [Anaerolineales bacterium]
MNKKGVLSIVCILLAATAACSAGPANPSAAATNTPRPSRTPTGVPTPTPTAMEIPTVEPVVTASPGPAPDLELLNVTFAEGPLGTIFMAEMRNNTSEAMIFPGMEWALRLGVEGWWESRGYYFHILEDVYVKPGSDDKRMNCVLYPGEVGVIAFDLSNYCSGGQSNCPGEWGELDTPPPHLGYRINNYEAFYLRWDEIYEKLSWRGYSPTIYEGYHPLPEKVKYEIRGSIMAIRFDSKNIPPGVEYQPFYTFPSWIILYDIEGKIINVLYEKLRYATGENQYYGIGIEHPSFAGKTPMAEYQWWETPDIENQIWESYAYLGEEELGRVARVRIFNEISDYTFCSKEL